MNAAAQRPAAAGALVGREAKSSSPLERSFCGTILDARARARLTGAIVVVAALVIFVPEVLRMPVPHGPMAGRRPEADTGPAGHAPAGRPQVRPGQPLASPAREQTRAAAAQDSRPAVVPATPTPAVPARAAPAPQAVSAPRRAAPPTDDPRGEERLWSVQLGSFASHANAERLAQQLSRAGVLVAVSRGKVAGRTLYRVRALPAGDRAAMEALAGRLAAAGHAGTVLPR